MRTALRRTSSGSKYSLKSVVSMSFRPKPLNFDGQVSSLEIQAPSTAQQRCASPHCPVQRHMWQALYQASRRARISVGDGFRFAIFTLVANSIAGDELTS